MNGAVSYSGCGLAALLVAAVVPWRQYLGGKASSLTIDDLGAGTVGCGGLVCGSPDILVTVPPSPCWIRSFGLDETRAKIRSIAMDVRHVHHVEVQPHIR